jgi:hypothetical protein
VSAASVHTVNAGVVGAPLGATVPFSVAEVLSIDVAAPVVAVGDVRDWRTSSGVSARSRHTLSE